MGNGFGSSIKATLIAILFLFQMNKNKDMPCMLGFGKLLSMNNLLKQCIAFSIEKKWSFYNDIYFKLHLIGLFSIALLSHVTNTYRALPI